MPTDPIPAANPTILSVTYDRWAFRLETQGFGAAGFGGAGTPPIGVTVTFAKCRDRDDGVRERSPLDSDVRQFFIEDLYALAAAEPGIGAAVQSLIAAIGDYAGRQGWL